MGSIYPSLALFAISEEQIPAELTAAEALAVDSVVHAEDSLESLSDDDTLTELRTDDTDCLVLVCGEGEPTTQCQQLRAQLSSLPIVVATPRDDRETISSLLSADDVEYVHMPADESFPVTELTLRVRQLVVSSHQSA